MEVVAQQEADLLSQHLLERQGEISRKPRIFCNLRYEPDIYRIRSIDCGVK